MKYTPGPWEITEQDIFGNGSFICSWSGKKADAHLIAAAPEMYEALKRVCKNCDLFCSMAAEEKCIVSKALNKAEGVETDE